MRLKIPEAFEGLFQPKRYKIYYGGRGGAKSWACAEALLAIGLSRPIRVLCARELQKSIKDSVHKLLCDIIKAVPEFRDHYDPIAQSIRGRNGTEFNFCGLKHNATEIKSYEGVDYVWVEEAQAVSENSWEILVPTIRKDDSEIWVCFNPKNPTDPTWKRFVMRKRDNAIVRKVNWRDNPFFPKVLNDERLDDKKNNPDAYDHIWEGSFDTRYSGTVYAKSLQAAMDDGRFKADLWDEELPVHTAWDLGYDDSTAIVFWQLVGKETRIIDCYEASGEDTEHYCNVLKGQIKDNMNEATKKKAARFKRYRYGKHWVPHDAAYKLMAAGGRSIVEQAYDLDVKMYVVPSTSQQNQIEATRKVLKTAWWDEDLATDCIQAMMAYHFAYDTDAKRFKSEPVHDWSSHFADACEIIGQVWRDDVKPEKPAAPRFLHEATANEVFWPDTSHSKSRERI